MFIWEGLSYTVSSALLAILLGTLSELMLFGVSELAFWSFSGYFTLVSAVLALPTFVTQRAVVPLIVYQSVSKHTIVEHL